MIGYQLPLRRRIRGIAFGLALVMGVSLSAPAPAQEPPLLKYLQQEPATLFDIGMKQLRRLALDATERLGSIAFPVPSTRVWFQRATGTIEILYLYKVSPESTVSPSDTDCRRLRAAAVRETFRIGRTAYDTALSPEERIRRRLRFLFSHEPVLGTKDAIRPWKKLARSTFVEVMIIGSSSENAISCRAQAEVISMTKHPISPRPRSKQRNAVPGGPS